MRKKSPGTADDQGAYTRRFPKSMINLHDQKNNFSKGLYFKKHQPIFAVQKRIAKKE
jgi:hypothetical protein